MKTNLWDVTDYDRELMEREEKAMEYIKSCIIRRYEKILNALMVVGGLVLLSLALIN